MTWPIVTKPSPSWSTLVDVLRARGQELGPAPLYTFLTDGEDEGDTLSYAQLERRARAIATRLMSEGLRGQPVLLLFPPGLEYIAGFLGCLCAGAVAVPAYPPFNERQAGRVQNIARAAGASVVLSTTAVITSARLLRAKHRLGRLVRRLPLMRGDDGRAGAAEFGDGLRWIAVSDAPDQLADEWRAPRLAAEDVAFVQYTSGSTSSPKGVQLSHANLLANLECIQRFFDLRSGTTSVSWLPPYHDMGLIGQILEPLYCGVWTYLMSPVSFLQQPLRWLRAISRVSAEVSGGPNFAYDLCARKARPEDVAALDLSTWRVAFNGAEPVRAETLATFARAFAPCGFRARAFYPCYGMAETTLIMAGGEAFGETRVASFDAGALSRGQVRPVPADAPGARALVSCGSTAPGHKLLIVDPDSAQVCPPGQIGEIWASGASVASAYWRAPEQTRAAFGVRVATHAHESFLRTGDLGFLDGGELYVTGRIKDLVIVRGRNHHPEDIEFTLAQAHPDLRPGCAAAFGVEADGAERLVLACEVRRQRSGSDAEVVQAMRTSVAEQHGVETHAVVLLRAGTIPKTSSGKIQRGATRAAYLVGELQPVAHWQHGGEAALVAPELAQDAASAGPVAAAAAEEQPAEEAREAARQRAEMAAWLATWVAERAGIAPHEVRGERPFASYGLGSQDVVRLSGDLEERLGRKVSPTIAYQYPSVDALATYLARGASDDAELDPAGTETDEPIAIVGLACRFPGAADAEAFWAALCEGRSAQASLPSGRWGAAQAFAEATPPGARYGAFLAQVDGFDAEFFGIASREAVHMDPQQRLLLEVAWEALERAGYVPARLAGSRTGVFVGLSNCDYAHLLGRRMEQVDAYAGTGTALSIAANRLSYLLDLRGPSLTVDTACSSSLVAVHLAVRSLRTGESDQCLVGGVNLMLSPLPALAFSQAQMLSPSGRCRPFDAAADGYVRGEGCGVIVLKRLSDARAAGDTVLALIRGTAVNQDGRSNGLTAPNGLAQQAVLRAALHDAGCAPAGVTYVEAHGTGTPLGDPIEMDSIKAVYAAARPVEAPLLVGSVKSNVGHLEAAAGIAGLIKTTLALQHGSVPPHAQLEQLNPRIELASASLALPLQSQPWPALPGSPRRAAVSSFGFGGTNCHVVLEQAPEPAAAEPETPPTERPLHVLALSARTPEALAELAARHAEGLRRGSASAADWAYSTHTTRTMFEQRAACVAGTSDQLALALERLAAGDGSAAATGSAAHGAPRLVFLFTGQGSQRVGMGRELYETQPTFRRVLEAGAQATAELLEEPLLDVMFGHAGRGELLGQTRYAQPALYVLEWALYELWRAWGVEPQAVLGHSVGEYAAAAAAGVWSFERGLELVVERARLMQSLPAGGAMLASSGLARERVEDLARRLGVDVAADNAPQELVLSGGAQELERAARELVTLGARVERLAVSHAFHSRLMDPALAEYERVLERQPLERPRLELLLNGTGAAAGAEVLQPRYWLDQLRGRVAFRGCVETLWARGPAAFVELGPGPVLLGLARRTHGEGGTWLASLRPGRGEWEQLLDSAARLWVDGMPLDLAGFDRDYTRRRVSLPSYPFQRRRYWMDGDAATPAPDSLLGRRVASPGTATLSFESAPDTEGWPMLADHRVSGLPVLPTTAFVDMALTAAAHVWDAGPVALHDLLILQPLRVWPRGGARLHTTLQTHGDEAHFSVAHAERERDLIASARVRRVVDAPPPSVAPEARRARLQGERDCDQFYAALGAAGLDYGPHFRGVVAAWSAPGEALGRVCPPAGAEEREAHALHPALLDACFQVLALAVDGAGARGTHLPFAVERIVRWRRAPGEVFAHARLRPDAPPDTLMGDIEVCDVGGDAVVSVVGLALRRAGAEQLARLRESLAAPPTAAPAASTLLARGNAHVLLGHALPSVADQPEARYWEREITPADVPYGGGLRRPDGVVLTAQSFVQIALAAAREARPHLAWRVVQVQAEAAFVCGGVQAERVQVQFVHGADESRVRVFAAPAAGGAWRLRASVRLADQPVEVFA